MSKIDFTGRVAIITGAGAGLGRCYALEMAKRGAKIVVNDLGGSRDGVGSDGAAANKVVEEIKALGGEAVPNYDSVATLAGGENIVNTAIKAFGKVDILINNAGILRDKTFIKMDEENWDAVMNVHLKGAFYVTRPAFENMRKNGYGRIVMTTSGAGLFGNFGQTNYASAKMGLIGLTNVLKIEGEKYNIKTNVIVPVAASRLTEDVLPPEFFEKMKPDFVASAVLYMCSEQCVDSGMIINAALGYYSRSAVVTGPGAILSDGVKIPTPEEVMGDWSKIISLDSPKYFNMLPEMFSVLGPVLK
ncbi:MAG TPA: SDR family oxidoreductase [Spirochaetota bacterium]|jgi:NAD(P)-dependent dehydrogenase (short-subunit alcohol dehydrogenase family)|nr:SDR family oxidoreductase [Spirochaetota bacterium]HNU91686.1 SDR family oxidoreductase [Spirochaetota bacterium]HPI15878.1 SDR family oxidoreductase [Spirochaetota bacterium]HPO45377.1 SDR family oxidoreductase [Spirochaetota bacterium]HPV98289.1 SDR family oxidoreductase [Spirochaetota bacterium]